MRNTNTDQPGHPGDVLSLIHILVSSTISLGVIWTWRRELYSRIFRMSSRLKSLLTTGFVIVLILSFQQHGGRID